MRIAVFSDIHGNLQALEAIIDDIKKNHFDEVICLGDIISIGPNSKECLDLIMKNNIRVLLGNHELYYINNLDKYNDVSEGEKRHLEWIKSSLASNHLNFLKKQDIVYNIDNVFFMHFPYNYDMDDFYNPNVIYKPNCSNIFKEYDGNIFIFGHEHKMSFFNELEKRFYCIGSSGCVKNNRTHYTVVEINKGVSVVQVNLDFDRYSFEQSLENTEYPEKEFLAINFFNYTI